MAQQTVTLFSFADGAVAFTMVYDDTTGLAVSFSYANTTAQNAGVTVTSNVTGRTFSRTLPPGSRTVSAPSNLNVSDYQLQAWWPA